MKLAQAVEKYIAFKLSLGMHFLAERNRLRAFCKFVGDVDAKYVIDESMVLRFLEGQGTANLSWHHKFKALKGFYNYAISRGYSTASPLPLFVPKKPPQFVPYIYSVEEIRKLIANTPKVCQHYHTKLEADTFRALLLILWGTGLRLGEALRLRLSDVDLESGVLTIYDTKFFKDRIVPMDPRLTTELSFYAVMRRRKPCRDGEDSVFFSYRNGASLTHSTTERKFRKLCNLTGVRRTGEARYQPRIHDMRHSFALNRLVSWYHQGADVQLLLPHLSTYLGHGSLSATQWYLMITPELLREANLRFESYAELEVSNG